MLPRWRFSRRRAAGSTGRQIIPPSANTIALVDTARRQIVLARCDRSPALLRIAASAGGSADMTAWMGELEVGQIPAELTPAFTRLAARAQAKGQQLFVHGQVERHDVDLCVVIHCQDPREK